jgi:hypothetical protein
LLFPAPTLILLPQPPVVPLPFDLLKVDGKLGEGGVIVRARGCQLNSSSLSSIRNTVKFRNHKFCSSPIFSPLIFSLDSFKIEFE